MKRPGSLFRRHFLVTVVVFGVMLWLAWELSGMIARQASRRDFDSGPLFHARLVDVQADRVTYVKQLREAAAGGFFMTFDLVDENGTSLVTGEPRWAPDKKAEIQVPSTPLTVPKREGLGRPPPGRFFGPPGPPPHMQGDLVVLLNGTPKTYLVQSMTPPTRGGPPSPWMFFLTFGAIVVAVLVASALSLYILFSSFREKASIAEKVISDLQHGDLKARFPVTRTDEVGQLMLSFNKMADEVERIVRNMRESEQARVNLLQELAHDLRTPVASLKNLLEMLQTRSQEMTPKLQGEIVDMSVKEVEYFARLVEDLLFLAQVMEPRYRAGTVDVDLHRLTLDQVDIVASRYPSIRPDIAPFTGTRAFALGDGQLLIRLVRNALDNAFSFATASVGVRIEESGSRILITIEDDGPGASKEAIGAFGQKLLTRSQESTRSGRITVGLGSVIMVKIAELHGGTVTLANRESGTGSRLVIDLPRSA